MKHSVIIMLFMVTTITAIHAQTPSNVRTEFEKKYPNTNATWRTENGYYNAYYSDDQKRQRMISYDKEGRILSNSILVTGADIPQNITVYYKNNYPTVADYKIWRDDVNGTVTYYTVNGNDRFYFDSNGNYVRKGNINDNMNKSNMERSNDKMNTPDSQNRDQQTPVPNPDNNNPK